LRVKEVALEVTREIELESAPEEVWDAIVETDWLGGETSIEPRPGGDVTVGPREGWVEQYAPAERLTIWWSNGDEESSRVQLDLEETEGGTRLVVTETRPLAALETQLPRGPVMLAA
jgi:uncharacterized protein YndB with AHSA1/START domain